MGRLGNDQPPYFLTLTYGFPITYGTCLPMMLNSGACCLSARTVSLFLSKMEVGVNLTKIWNSTLGTMQVQTSRHEFNTWLRRATLQSVDNGVATIGAPSAFFKEGLENRYSSPLRDLLSNLVGAPLQVRVVIAGPQATRVENGPAPR